MTTLTPAQAHAIAARDLFLNKFPNAFARVATSELMPLSATLFIGLIGDVKDCANGYRQNDVLAGIYNFSMAGHKLVVTLAPDTSVRFYRTPLQFHYAMSTVKVPFRKINNEPTKALKAMDKHFTNMWGTAHELIAENKLYNQSSIPSKYLQIA